MEQEGVKEDREYSILTAEISKATFGMTPSQHKEHKGLKRENLRDHMNDLELIFSMLGEAATTEITRNKDTQGFEQNKIAAKEGGTIAGNARKELEQKSGKKVVSKQNYLPKIKERKKSRREDVLYINGCGTWLTYVNRGEEKIPNNKFQALNKFH